jgi:hypothetical protein
MTIDTILLALLVFALIATRPFEERRWRDGRITDRTAALLVVGRLPVHILGFALIAARPAGETLLLAAIALVVAGLLYPLVLARLRGVRGAG